MPVSLAELLSWLAGEGYRLKDSGTGGGPVGDRLLRLTNGDMGVRLTRHDGEWSVGLSCRAWGGGWFDASLVAATLDHRDLAVPMGLAEQVDFVKARLGRDLARADDQSALWAALQESWTRKTRLQFGL